MTREEAITILRCLNDRNAKCLELTRQYPYPKRLMLTTQAIDMAIESLSANATVAKIQIDDIDKAKTSLQLLDELAVDMVNAMGRRIVEVVRCKDCRHYGSDGGALMVCDVSDMVVDDADYCSYGERREP